MASDKEMASYLKQIRYLEEQLDSCRPKREQMEKEYQELVSEFAVLQEDSKIQTGHLKRILTAKEKKVSELLEQLENEHQEAKRYRDNLMPQHSKEMQEMRERIEKLKSENKIEVKKLEQQKKDLISVNWRLSAMESLWKQLEKQKEEHDIATKTVKVAEQVEMDRKVERLQSIVEPTVKLKTEKILTKNRAEHEERLEQLHFLKSELVPLQEDVDAMQARQRDLCSEQDELEKDFIKIIQQKSILKKNVHELREQCQQLTTELKDCTLDKLRTLAKIKTLSQSLSLVHEECRQKSARITSLSDQIQKVRCKNLKLEGVKQEAAIILGHILSDAEKSSENQWKVQRLLEILESTAVL
ncbi:uncharacterized protein cfap157 isoform X1 [Maylandia zebra]|uniref:uncharacterized protein cfap157 isoform X1 n=1 Tax=Maylandia zebra TaxID=106582 RepID=UPI000329F818|nr:cilia- and flagella-associated protein 157 isoform X1 [Maylandia zebra]